MEEDGATLKENAMKKVLGYFKEDSIKTLSSSAQLILLGDDTGLKIDALGGEPGRFVRRWKGYHMTDEEIISHCLERLQGVPMDKRTATLCCVIAVAIVPMGEQEAKLEFFEGELRGRILESAEAMRIKDFPLESLFFVDSWGKEGLLLGDAHLMDPGTKQAQGILTHRAVALQGVADLLKSLK